MINRKITYFGIGGMQLMALFTVGLLIVAISRIALAIYATVIFLVLKRYQAKSSNGDPAYIDTWRLSRSCPEHLQDRIPEK